MAERSKGELAFIDQMTRKLLVEWGDHLARGYPLDAPSDHGQVYWDHALAKSFVTKKEPRRLTSKGWAAAASFLKR